MGVLGGLGGIGSGIMQGQEAQERIQQMQIMQQQADQRNADWQRAQPALDQAAANQAAETAPVPIQSGASPVTTTPATTDPTAASTTPATDPGLSNSLQAPAPYVPQTNLASSTPAAPAGLAATAAPSPLTPQGQAQVDNNTKMMNFHQQKLQAALDRGDIVNANAHRDAIGQLYNQNKNISFASALNSFHGSQGASTAPAVSYYNNYVDPSNPISNVTQAKDGSYQMTFANGQSTSFKDWHDVGANMIQVHEPDLIAAQIKANSDAQAKAQGEITSSAGTGKTAQNAADTAKTNVETNVVLPAAAARDRAVGAAVGGSSDATKGAKITTLSDGSIAVINRDGTIKPVVDGSGNAVKGDQARKYAAQILASGMGGKSGISNLGDVAINGAQPIPNNMPGLSSSPSPVAAPAPINAAPVVPMRSTAPVAQPAVPVRTYDPRTGKFSN